MYKSWNFDFMYATLVDVLIIQQFKQQINKKIQTKTTFVDTYKLMEL